MKSESLADFMFAGVVIIPGALAWFDQIGLAMFAFTALLLVACLCGWNEQISDADREQASGKSGDSAPRSPPPTGHTLRRYAAG